MSSDRNPLRSGQAGFRVELATTSTSLQEAQQLRHQVFCLERGLFEARPGEHVEQDEWDAGARHILLRRSHDGAVVATTRVVPGSAARWTHCLPMHSYCSPNLFGHLNLDTVGEVSRFAISKEARSFAGNGPIMRLGLLRGIVAASLELGLTHWCALMEPSLIRLLRTTGIHFTHLGGPVEAYGVRHPCITGVGLTMAMCRRIKPTFFDTITAGVLGHGSSGRKTHTAQLVTSRAA